MDESLPNEFDAIVVGTGLVESIYAAAVARCGKSVLHLDRNEYYSDEWAVFNWNCLQQWAERHSQNRPPSSSSRLSKIPEDSCGHHGMIELRSGSCVSNVAQYFFIPESGDSDTSPSADTDRDCLSTPLQCGTRSSGDVQADSGGASGDSTEANGEPVNDPAAATLTDKCEPVNGGWSKDKLRSLSRHFNIELTPKVLYSRGALVELLISSNTARYAEFRGVTHIVSPLRGRLTPVPSSRADVFATSAVSVVEKRLLMKLLSFCVEHEQRHDEYADWSERPFDEFLRRQHRLTPDLVHYVTHAISMVEPSTRTAVALQAARRFLVSLGRYGNTPFLWPSYGSGELAQCFCRMCAVFGGIYHLSRDVQSLVLSPVTDSHRTGDESTTNDSPIVPSVIGVVSNGHRFSCSRMVLASRYTVSGDVTADTTDRVVSRAVLLLNAPLSVPGVVVADAMHVVLMRIPSGQLEAIDDSAAETSVVAPVTVLQLTHATAAVPPGLVLVHLICKGCSTAEADLRPVVELLLHYSRTGGSTGDNNIPILLTALYFNRRCGDPGQRGLPEGVSVASAPDDTLCFESAVEEARRLFSKHFPGEEFLPRAPDPDEIIYFDDHESPVQEVSADGNVKQENFGLNSDSADTNAAFPSEV